MNAIESLVEEKELIILDVFEEIEDELRTQISDIVNSVDFKLDLQERLEERGIEVDFVNMDKTKIVSGIILEKYEVYFDDVLFDNIRKDLIIK